MHVVNQELNVIYEDVDEHHQNQAPAVVVLLLLGTNPVRQTHQVEIAVQNGQLVKCLHIVISSTRLWLKIPLNYQTCQRKIIYRQILHNRILMKKETGINEDDSPDVVVAQKGEVCLSV